MKNRLFLTALAAAAALTLTACGVPAGENDPAARPGQTADITNDGGDRFVVEDTGKVITVIDDPGSHAPAPGVTVGDIVEYQGIEISDWLDQDTAVVSMENQSLPRMSLAELSDSHPRSLYLYHLETDEYELLQANQDLNLSGAALSPDKRHLLYAGNSLGDPSYYVMDMDTLEAMNISGAYSAQWKWADSETVLGGSNNGGAYAANVGGEASPVAGLEDESLYIVQKVKGRVYYNTQYDGTLMALDPGTGEKSSLGIENVYGVYPSPDGNQMLVLQYSGSKSILMLYSAEGGNIMTIAEGAELGGVSWSPDQLMAAYTMKADENGAAANGLYVFNMLTGENTQIAVGVGSASTCWSPSGKELAYAVWDGNGYSSSIIHLDYSLQES